MRKILNIALILTPLLGYLHWGADMHTFLFQLEYDLIFGNKGSSDTYLHPFIAFPAMGQFILLVSLFQKTPGRILTYVGLSCLSLLMLFILLVGCLAMDIKIIASTLPFIVTAIITLRYNRKRKVQKP